ncbi:hypothetical protein RDABS01_035101 [Bienertia sinuspersici]
MSDTGNFIHQNPSSNFANLPYGQTFFHKPTGRCSNGLLMIDYITNFFNLPFLDPYLNKNDGNFSHGVNFAVAGATALSCSTLAKKGIEFCPANSSLLVQLDWFNPILIPFAPLHQFARFHNDKLQVVLGEVRKDHPKVTIVYADYYSSLTEILQNATSLGFDTEVMQTACCANCGSKGVAACEHPYKHINWDQVHLTQHTYQLITRWLIEHNFGVLTSTF